MLDAYPFGPNVEATRIFDAERWRAAFFLVPMVGNVINLEPRLLAARHDGNANLRLGRVLHFRLGPLVAAILTGERCQRDVGFACRTDLGAHTLNLDSAVLVPSAARAANRHRVNRTMPANIARKIEHEAVRFLIRQARTSAQALHVEAGR